MSYLVDANVFSEATHSRPDPKVMAWLDDHDAELYVSSLTLAEICKGIQLLESGARRRKLESWFEELSAGFGGRILPVDEAVARAWGIFYAKHQRQGRLLSSFDSLLAATALTHGLTLVTRNTADFPDEVKVINPWL